MGIEPKIPSWPGCSRTSKPTITITPCANCSHIRLFYILFPYPIALPCFLLPPINIAPANKSSLTFLAPVFLLSSPAIISERAFSVFLYCTCQHQTGHFFPVTCRTALHFSLVMFFCSFPPPLLPSSVALMYGRY